MTPAMQVVGLIGLFSGLFAGFMVGQVVGLWRAARVYRTKER